MNMRELAGGQLSWGVDEVAEVKIDVRPGYRWHVINYTHRWFSIGASTSGQGFLGVSCHWKNLNRRQDKNGFTHHRYRGCISQVWLGLFKIYLYVYFDGDGLG